MTATLSKSDADAPPSLLRRFRGRLIAAAALLVALLLAWVLAFSPVLGASRITVRGNAAVPTQQVLTAAKVAHGTPLLRLDTAAVARRVETLPGVATARVTVTYPSTVTITVTERTPVGYLQDGDSSVLVDRTGKQYREQSGVPPNLPRFDVPTGAAGQAAGGAVATVAGSLPATVLKQLSAIQASDPDAVTLTLRDGRTVYWGGADRSADKARLLPALLGQPGKNFDVSNPDTVYSH